MISTGVSPVRARHELADFATGIARTDATRRPASQFGDVEAATGFDWLLGGGGVSFKSPALSRQLASDIVKLIGAAFQRRVHARR